MVKTGPKKIEELQGRRFDTYFENNGELKSKSNDDIFERI